MQGFTENTPRADEIVQGKSRLSVAPVDPYEPIAVGDNDPRLNVIYDLTSPTTITVGNLPSGTNITGLTLKRILELILTDAS